MFFSRRRSCFFRGSVVNFDHNLPIVLSNLATSKKVKHPKNIFAKFLQQSHCSILISTRFYYKVFSNAAFSPYLTAVCPREVHCKDVFYLTQRALRTILQLTCAGFFLSCPSVNPTPGSIMRYQGFITVIQNKELDVCVFI